MNRSFINHIATILFISLLMLKGAGSLAGIFLSSLNNKVVSEMLLDIEREQETKNSKTVETSFAEDVYEEAFQVGIVQPLLQYSGKQLTGHTPSLQDVYLDTLTPPPNRA